MKCKKCDGTGLETYMSEPGVYERDGCPECKGTGIIDWENDLIMASLKKFDIDIKPFECYDTFDGSYNSLGFAIWEIINGIRERDKNEKN